MLGWARFGAAGGVEGESQLPLQPGKAAKPALKHHPRGYSMGQGPVGVRDRFANFASIQVTQTAANALTFGSLSTNMGFLGRRDQALAMVIDEIQYSPGRAAIDLMTAGGDHVTIGLTTSDLITDLEDLTDKRLLDFHEIHQILFTAVGAVNNQFPFRKQFFPPLITAERTLFMALASGGLASAITSRIRILFRVETLTGAELVELSEAFLLTS